MPCGGGSGTVPRRVAENLSNIVNEIADELVKSGYTTISFDAPAHGRSPGNNSIMVDFIASINELNKQRN